MLYPLFFMTQQLRKKIQTTSRRGFFYVDTRQLTLNANAPYKLGCAEGM